MLASFCSRKLLSDWNVHTQLPTNFHSVNLFNVQYNAANNCLFTIQLILLIITQERDCLGYSIIMHPIYIKPEVAISSKHYRAQSSLLYSPVTILYYLVYSSRNQYFHLQFFYLLDQYQSQSMQSFD